MIKPDRLAGGIEQGKSLEKWVGNELVHLVIAPGGGQQTSLALRARHPLVAGICVLATILVISAAGAGRLLAQPVPMQPVRRNLATALAQSSTESIADIPVVTIRFLPTADGVYLDRTKAPDYWDIHPITLNEKNAELDLTTLRIKFALTEGSRFRDYGDETAPAALGYRIVDEIVFYQVPPASGSIFSPYDNHPPALDYDGIFNAINARHYVDDLGVKEFWVYYNTCDPSFPSWQQEPGAYDPANTRWLVETNMASPTTGDISNSLRYANDLPLFQKTYVVYEYGLVSDMSDFVHEHGHELEAMFSYAAIQQDGTDYLFWNDFAGRISQPNETFVMGTGRCGSTHYPPNTTTDYDYSNPNFVNSDIADWRPDHQGQQMPVNKDTWGSVPYPWPEITTQPFKFQDAQWYVYWMQSMPGYKNTIPKGDGEMTNWWQFVSGWDEMVTARAGLYTQPAAFGGRNLSANGMQGHAFSFQAGATMASPYYAAVGLPVGLNISETTGLISGIPVSSGTFSVLITATDGATHASTKLFLTIGPDTLQVLSITPYLGRIRLTGRGDPATHYNVEGSPDLNPKDFIGIGGVTTDDNGNWFFDDWNSNGFPARFYRVLTTQ
jgi:hypothetical protein